MSQNMAKRLLSLLRTAAELIKDSTGRKLAPRCGKSIKCTKKQMGFLSNSLNALLLFVIINIIIIPQTSARGNTQTHRVFERWIARIGSLLCQSTYFWVLSCWGESPGLISLPTGLLLTYTVFSYPWHVAASSLPAALVCRLPVLSSAGSPYAFSSKPATKASKHTPAILALSVVPRL